MCNVLDKLETISKILTALLIPLAIAYMGNEISLSNSRRDSETKLIELATVILNKEPTKADETHDLRKWAVEVINKYSGVPMTAETKSALINRVPLPNTNIEPQQSTGPYGVVFGGDRTLAEAQYEIKTTAKKAGVNNAQIYLRSGSYRSVAVFATQSEASDVLGKLIVIRDTTYTVDMAKWCANSIERLGYYECTTK